MSLLLKEGHAPSQGSDIIADALNSVRAHLDMDVSFLTEFADDGVFLRAISHNGVAPDAQPGDWLQLNQTYCGYIANGSLPQLIQDTSDYPITQEILATQQMPIRAHIGVPVTRRDGRLYGMFCCLATKPNRTLNQRDLDVVTMFTNMVTHSINDKLEAQEAKDAARAEISGLINNNLLETYLQPIVSLHDGRTMAFEALSRFSKDCHKGPLWWFNNASKANMQAALEMKAIRSAVAYLPNIPAPTYLSVNVSPDTIGTIEFADVMDQIPPNRMFIELTEHEEIAETADLMQVMKHLRERKIGIAIDDVGAGYSGLSTIVRLRPNVLKLDRSLVDDIHRDKAKQSLTSALLGFAEKMHAFLIAEGVESVADDLTLKSLGARLGQGFLYDRPAPAHEFLTAERLLQHTSRAS